MVTRGRRPSLKSQMREEVRKHFPQAPESRVKSVFEDLCDVLMTYVGEVLERNEPQQNS